MTDCDRNKQRKITNLYCITKAMTPVGKPHQPNQGEKKFVRSENTYQKPHCF